MQLSDFGKSDYKSIICDGSNYSGHASATLRSFIDWAMTTFTDRDFAMCARAGFRLLGNVIQNEDLRKTYRLHHDYLRHDYHSVTLEMVGALNRFHFFDGLPDDKPTSNYRMHGYIFSGAYFYDVAMLPQSFVEMICARCNSVSESKYWFVSYPYRKDNWFYQEWIKHAEEKNAVYLHFTAKDNPYFTFDMMRMLQRNFQVDDFRSQVLGEWIGKDEEE